MSKQSLITQLSEQEDTFVGLIVECASKYKSNNIKIMKHVCNKEKYAVVYLSINKPHELLDKDFKNKKINVDNIFYIDAITSMIKTERKNMLNCIHIPSPKRLTDISIASVTAIKQIKRKRKLLYLDSLTTLFMYNTTGSVVKFIHYITSVLRRSDASGILISLEKEMSPRVLSQISQFCDVTIKDV